jgi:hypothetical protein
MLTLSLLILLGRLERLILMLRTKLIQMNSLKSLAVKAVTSYSSMNKIRTTGGQEIRTRREDVKTSTIIRLMLKMTKKLIILMSLLTSVLEERKT